MQSCAKSTTIAWPSLKTATPPVLFSLASWESMMETSCPFTSDSTWITLQLLPFRATTILLSASTASPPYLPRSGEKLEVHQLLVPRSFWVVTRQESHFCCCFSCFTSIFIIFQGWKKRGNNNGVADFYLKNRHLRYKREHIEQILIWISQASFRKWLNL